MGKELAGSTLGKALWIESRAFRYQLVEPEGARNFAEARKLLKAGYSILATPNHIGAGDLIVEGHAYEDHLTSLDDLISPAAAAHVDPKRGIANLVKIALIEELKKATGFSYEMVVQGKDRSRYPNSMQINNRALVKIADFLRPGGKVALLPLEGTRSRTGRLLRPETRGVELILRRVPNLRILPVAMEPAPFPTFMPKILPIITNTRFYVGDPYSPEQLLAEYGQISERLRGELIGWEKPRSPDPDVNMVDVMMSHVARLLPERYRGDFNLLINHPALQA